MRSFMHRLLPPKVDAFAKDYLRLVQRGSVDSAIGLLEPSLRGPSTGSQLLTIAAILKNAPVDSVDLVGVSVSVLGSGSEYDVSYQVRGDTAWVLTNVSVIERDGAFHIHGLHAEVMHQSLAVTNALTLSDKPAFYGAFAAVAILIVLFNFSVAVMTVRSRIRRRWLWAALALVGVGGFSLNWTTGNLSFQPLSFQFCGAGIVKAGLYAPWVASFALPVFAVAALVKVRRGSRVKSEPAPAPVPAP